jgi:ribosomal protein L37E
MSRPIIGNPTHDWKEAFKCPRCGKGHFRIRIDEVVCDKCGYRKPFKEKIRRIIDG